MVISNSLVEDTELHYTHSLYPEEPFLVIRAKKEKNASESPVVRASQIYNHHLWYALFPLYKEMLQIFKKIRGSYLDTDIIICYDNNLHVVLRER